MPTTPQTTNEPAYSRPELVELYPLYEAAVTFCNRYEDAWNHVRKHERKPAQPRTHFLVRGKKVPIPQDNAMQDAVMALIKKHRKPGLDEKAKKK